MSTRILISTVAAGLLALSGCGGDGSGGGDAGTTTSTSASSRLSPDQYRAELRALNREISQAEQTAVEVLSSGGTTEELRQAILGWAEAEEQASQRLSELRPPEDAVAANRDLAVAEEQFAEALRGATDALEGAPISEVPQILQREMEDAPAAKRLDRAIEELNALGY